MNEHVALREFIQSIINEKERTRDLLRIEDHRRIDVAVATLENKFNASVADVDKAARLLFTQNAEHFDKLNHAHEEAQRILSTYAALRDFNEFKSKTELALAEILGRLKSLDESKVSHEQRLRNIEDVQPPVAARLKELETQGAGREERLRSIESAETGRSSLSKEEKERMARTLHGFQILSGIAVLVSVAMAILTYVTRSA